MNRLATKPGRNYLVYEAFRSGKGYSEIADEFRITRGRVGQIVRHVASKIAMEPRRVFAQPDEIMGAL